MILVTRSPEADSRTAKANATKEDLKRSTISHVNDVQQGMKLLADALKARGLVHDHTKLENMDLFHAALTGMHVKESEWYQMHITKERHHIKAHVPEDVNLIDIMECVVDCTMAAVARGNGDVYDVDIPPEVMQLAINNTVALLKRNITVVPGPSRDDSNTLIEEAECDD